MTDFQRLKIEIYAYRRIAEKAEFFVSVGEWIDDAVTGQRGDGDWFGEVQDFFNEVRTAWKTMEEREAEGVVQLNHESSERYLANVQPDQIGTMGLVEVLTLLRKATVAEPQIEEYNWTCPGNQERKSDPQRDQRFIDGYRKGLILPALRRLNDLLEITPADIEAVLSLKPIFDSLSVEEFRSWNGWEPMDLPEGGQALHVPYPDYHPVVSQWFELLYQTPFYIDPYAALPEDPTPDGVPFSVMGAHFPPEYFENATLDQVRRYMLLCTRGEKFCDGHIAGEFESGVIQAAFARLEALDRVTAQGDAEPKAVPRRRIGDLGRYLNGFPFKQSDWKTTGRPIIRIQNLTDQSKPFNYFEGSLDDRYIVRNGDILISWAASLGIFVWNGVEAGLNQHIFKVELDAKVVDRRYFLHAFESVLNELRGQAHGSTMRHVTRDVFDSQEIPLPSIAEQRGIATALDVIQAARLARLREIDLERERKAALTAHLFAYGTQNEPRRDTPLGPIPESWEQVELGACLREKFKNGHSARESADGKGIRTFTLSAVTYDDFSLKNSKVTTADATKAKDIWVKSGDIFVERGNTPELVGTAAMYIGPDDMAIFPDLLIRVRPRLDTLNPTFLLHYLRSEPARDYCRRQASGTAGSMPKIDHAKLAVMPVPLPSLIEQGRIAEALDRQATKIRALEAEAKLLDELFRATLEELMSGRLSVAPLLSEVVA